PTDVMHNAHSHTGQALQEYEHELAGLATPTDEHANATAISTAISAAPTLQEAVPTYGSDTSVAPAADLAAQASRANNEIAIINAREHNLKGVEVSIPHNTFTVITGVSGSGKSTLAFDILFNEGQRRYLESLNAYARAIVQPAGKPDVDAIYGIPPTVAIEQRTSRGGRKSTVATMTEIHHFLRLLYMKLGTQYCPHCDIPVEPQRADQIVANIMQSCSGKHIGVLAPLVKARKGYYTDLAKWAAARGHSHLRVDGEFVAVSPWPRLDRYKEHTIELPVRDLIVEPSNERALREA